MFGYVKTYTPELRVRENEYYRAIYCGLCKSQGKCTGQCSRFTLSYDMAFLALVRLALSDEKVEFAQGRCMAHPLKKRSYAKRCQELDYCAYASALLVYGKCRDDLSDEHGIKKFKAKLQLPFASHMRKKSLKKYSALDKIITDGLYKLSQTEKQKLPSVDIPADCFGDILGEICAGGYDGANRKILYDIGRHIGRWIYIADAIDDCDDDFREGRYNPFVCLYGGRVPTAQERLNVSESLRLELARAELAFDLLDCDGKRDIRGIIDNIIYVSMPRTADELSGKSCRDNSNKKRPKKNRNN